MRIVCEKLRCLVFVFLLAVIATAQGQAKDLTNQMPADTWFLVSVQDMSQLREKWSNSPYQEAWKSPEFSAVRKVIEDGWKEMMEDDANKSGVNVQDVLGVLNGNATFLSTMNEVRVEGDYTTREWDTCFVAEVSKNDHKEIRRILDDILKTFPEDAKKSVEVVKGEKVYVIEYYRQQEADDAPDELEGLQLMTEVPMHIEYMLTDDYFIICEGRNQPLRQILAGLKGDKERAVQSVSRFKDISRKVGTEGDFALYFNPQRLIEQQAKNPESPDLIEKMQQFGLQDVGPVLFTWGINEEGLFTRGAVAVPEEHMGLLSLVYAGEPNRVTTAKYVPSDIYSYVSYTANLKEIWAGARALARIASPQVDSILSAYLMSSVSNFNVDVEADILNNIMGEHAYYQRGLPAEVKKEVEAAGVPSSTLSEVFLFATANGEKLVQTLDQFFDRLSGEPYQFPIEHYTQRGFNIWTVKQDAGEETPLRFSIALTPSHVILANNLIEAQEAVRRVTGESNNSLATSKSFNETIGDADREGLRVLSYTSQEAAALMSEQMRELVDLGLLDTLDIETEDVPPAEWWKRYFSSARQSAQFLPDMIVVDSQWFASH